MVHGVREGLLGGEVDLQVGKRGLEEKAGCELLDRAADEGSMLAERERVFEPRPAGHGFELSADVRRAVVDGCSGQAEADARSRSHGACRDPHGAETVAVAQHVALVERDKAPRALQDPAAGVSHEGLASAHGASGVLVGLGALRPAGEEEALHARVGGDQDAPRHDLRVDLCVFGELLAAAQEDGVVGEMRKLRKVVQPYG